MSDRAFCLYLKSLLLASSPGEITQGRLWGRHSRASGGKSEKSTPYSVRIPSVSGSISPACPRLLANCLQKERKKCFFLVYNYHRHVVTVPTERMLSPQTHSFTSRWVLTEDLAGIQTIPWLLSAGDAKHEPDNAPDFKEMFCIIRFLQ